MPREFVIAIPTYNEAENIARLIPALKEAYGEIAIFVVDDNSPDGTAEIVKKLAGRFPGIKLMERPRKEGFASAYREAFDSILQDKDVRHIITMDADLSHHPADLAKLLDAALQYDIVVGSRYILGGRVENWSFWRRGLSYFGNLYARLITGLPVADLTAGFVLYGRGALERILKEGVRSHGYAYQIEMKYLAHKQKATIKEVPITFRERANGKSKLSYGVVFEGVITPWHLRFFR